MYNIEFTSSAAKALERVYTVDKKLYYRFITAIESLRNNPFQGKRLKGKLAGDFSLRMGDYRILYTVHKEKLVVYIIDLGHRKEIYK